jgi:hypothetical protein
MALLQAEFALGEKLKKEDKGKSSESSGDGVGQMIPEELSYEKFRKFLNFDGINARLAKLMEEKSPK